MNIVKTSLFLVACSLAALVVSASIAAPDGTFTFINHDPLPENIAQPTRPNSIDRICGDKTQTKRLSEFQAQGAKRITEELKLSEIQIAAFKELQAIRDKNATDGKAALCATKPDLSNFEKRLAFGESLAQRHVDNLKSEDPKLIAFYNTLDTHQKFKFERIAIHRSGPEFDRHPGHGPEFGIHPDPGASPTHLRSE